MPPHTTCLCRLWPNSDASFYVVHPVSRGLMPDWVKSERGQWDSRHGGVVEDGTSLVLGLIRWPDS
jgi:hypothetical protein